MPTQPQDRKRPAAKKVTASSQKRQQAADDEALDVGYALDDDDGKKLTVRLRDVRASQEAALLAETGHDFMGLMESMMNRQTTVGLAQMLWFARLVNGRESKTYAETLDEVGYADLIDRNFDQAQSEDDDSAPKASAGT